MWSGQGRDWTGERLDHEGHEEHEGRGDDGQVAGVMLGLVHVDVDCSPVAGPGGPGIAIRFKKSAIAVCESRSDFGAS